MRLGELARRRAVPSPARDEFTVLREFHDARVGLTAVAVRDEDIAVGTGRDVGGPLKVCGPAV